MPIYFLFDLVATWRPYLFFGPHDNTVLAYISKIVQDRVWPVSSNLFKITTELLLIMDSKSYMRFIWHYCL